MRSILLSSIAVYITLLSVALSVEVRQTTFKHPGVFVSQAQLDYTKSQLTSAPWKAAYQAMDSYTWGRITWNPNSTATVRCEDPNSPQFPLEKNCKEERYDALSAYSMALRWAYTGEIKYANQAIRIFDAWSGTLVNHVSAAPEQNGLQSGWVASSWTRAGEIIRYTNAGWSSASITKFENMLKNVYLPQVRNGSADEPNNIDSVMLEAAQGIAIFTNNRTLYDSVMKRYKQHVPSYIYLKSDGAYPKIPEWTTKYRTPERVKALWQNDDSYFEGRSQETCRDLEHTSYGIASISHMMETAYIQGENLYATEYGTRLKAALEFHSSYADGGAVSNSSICKGILNEAFLNVAEPFYNGFVTRAGGSLPKTKVFIASTRPADPNSLFTAWETLTHAQNPK